MAVIRIEKNRNYTTMCNHHLRNQELSLKAKGLLSMMLSLPDNWNYTTKGLTKLSRDGKESIGGALKELEKAGYVVRNRLRDSRGRITDTEYVIYERPRSKGGSDGGNDEQSDESDEQDTDENGGSIQGEDQPHPDLPHPDLPHPDLPHPDLLHPVLPYPGNPDADKPDTDDPDAVEPDTEEPEPEYPPQLNINQTRTHRSNTHRPKINPSNPYPSTIHQSMAEERDGCDAVDGRTIRRIRLDIEDRIGYDEIVTRDNKADLDAIVGILTEIHFSTARTIRVGGSAYPAELVKQHLSLIDCQHIEYILNSIKSTRTEIRNMKQYLLTTLFNAPTVMNSHTESILRREGLY